MGTSDGTDSPLLDVRDVSVAYGDVAVLSGLSLAVDRGELVGLVGPNGAGKTTLLKAINGVLAPDAGRVAVAGDDVHDLSSRAASRRVATVPQDTTVAFEFAVEDVVEMGRTPYHGRVSGDPDAAAAVERALARTETARFRDRPVSSLSGGERQRVVLARALAQETPALVLDEPTASLDVDHQVRTLELVRDLTRSADKAALAAVHDLDLAARFCDRIAVLSGGDVVADGPPADVLTADTVEAAYDTAAVVLPNPVTGTPSVTPLSGRSDTSSSEASVTTSGASATTSEASATPSSGRAVTTPESSGIAAPEGGSADPADLTVHVAGTGPLAARSVAAFAQSRATVTAGVLPPGDLAATTATELGVETVTAPPFESLDATATRATRAHLDRADVAVIAGPVPPAVQELLRDGDPDAVVRVVDGTAGDASGPSPDAGNAWSHGDDATGAPVTAVAADVVAVAARVAGRSLDADD